MPATADRCKETSITAGTGPVTLAGPSFQFQDFKTGLGTRAVRVMYSIVSQTTGDWEVGEGTFDGNNILTRDTVRSSSNGNNRVNFPAGTKDVFATLTANQASKASLGRALALSSGMAML